MNKRWEFLNERTDLSNKRIFKKILKKLNLYSF